VWWLALAETRFLFILIPNPQIVELSFAIRDPLPSDYWSLFRYERRHYCDTETWCWAYWAQNSVENTVDVCW